jgi:hypothetical protein
MQIWLILATFPIPQSEAYYVIFKRRRAELIARNFIDFYKLKEAYYSYYLYLNILQ